MPPRSSARSSRAAAAARSPWEASLSRLKVLCGKASKAERDAITATEVSAVVDGLRHMPGHLGLWTAGGEDSLAGLVALFGLALRRSCPALAPQLSADSHATFGALRLELCMGLPQVFEDHANGLLPTAASGAVAQGLIRTHALRCYSVLLSQAAEQLQRRRSHRGVQAAASKLLDEVGVLLSLFATEEKGRLPWAPAGLGAELYAELCASGVLEHFARLISLLVGCEEAGAKLLTQAAACLSVVSTSLFSFMPNEGQDMVRLFADSPSFAYLLSAHVVGVCAAVDGGTLYGMPAEASVPAREDSMAEDATRAPVLSAYVAVWALFMWMSAIRQGQQQLQNDLRAAGCPQRYPAAAADGAPPCSAAAAAPDPAATTDAAWCQDPWRIQVRRVRDMGDSSTGGDGVQAAPASAPAPLRRWVGCASAPPLHTRAVFELSLRLAAAGVRQVREEQQQQQEVQPRQRSRQAGRAAVSESTRRPLPLRFKSSHARDLVVRGLQCAYIAADGVAMLPRVRQSVYLRLEAFWRLLMEAVELMGRTGAATPDGADVGCLMQLTRPERVPRGAVQELPSAPTPDVAACLNAGWVRRVERLLRQADAPQQLPLSMEPARVRQEAAFSQILAFGRQREVLSLLATAAKRVLWSAGRPPRAANLRSPFEHCVADMRLLVSQQPLKHLRVLEDAARQQEVCTDAPVVGPVASPDVGTNESTIDGGQGAATHDGGSEAVAGAVAATVPDGASDAAGVATAAVINSGCSAAGAAGSSDGLRQLRIAVSFAVVHLLPAMCRAFEQFPMVLDWFGRDKSPAYGRAVFSTMSLFAAWLPLMAAAHTYTDWGAQLFDARVVAPVLWAVLRYAAFVSPSTALDADFTPVLVITLQALCRLAPALLADAVRRVEATEDGLSDGGGGKDGAAASSGAVGPLRVSLLRRVLGPGGAAQNAELLAAVEAVCAEHGGAGDSSAGDGAGGGGSGSGIGGSAAKPPTAGWREQPPLARELEPWVRIAELLVPPAELAAVLPLCANPACVNLDGDSEAELPLTVLCGGGGGTCQLAYCSAGCRDEHAGKGGHRERCLL